MAEFMCIYLWSEGSFGLRRSCTEVQRPEVWLSDGFVQTHLKSHRKPQVSPAQETTNESGNADLKSTDVVAFTSRLIAVARAIESRRPDRLFNDPFAEILAGSEAMNSYENLVNFPIQMYELSQSPPGRDMADTPAARENRPYQSPKHLGALGAGDVSLSRRLAIRTRCCDDFFEDCTLPPRCIKQVVMLGAGMDTRGLRLRASIGTSVFEVDQALVLAVKRNILQRTLAASEAFSKESPGGVFEARVIGVEADLGQTGWEEKLLDAGFNLKLPSAWILEGLTIFRSLYGRYLDEQELVSLIEVVAKLCSSGSAFCVTCNSAKGVRFAKASNNSILRTWKWGSDNPKAFFEGHFPATWTFKCVAYGTPGEFPEGADYSVGYQGKGPAYVIGYRN